jgi:hypothetical protein
MLAVIAAVALLLSGAAAASVGMPGPQCGRAGPAMVLTNDLGGAPCGHDEDGTDHPMPSVGSHVCFAKCPAPMLGQDASTLTRSVLPILPPPPRIIGLAGIGVAPPLQPPRA